MSRDHRDQRGGHKSKYWVSMEHIAEFKRQCRRAVRHQANQTLRQGIEPPPRYPVEHWYWN